MSGSSTSVYAATQPLDPQEVKQDYFYYSPYWSLCGLLIPFEVGGPHYRWKALRPRLPADPDRAAQDLWDLSESMASHGPPPALSQKKER